MTKELIEQWLTGVTYKPGWSVEYAGDIDNRRLFIIVNATQPDVCNPGKEFHISPLFEVPKDITTREPFYDWIIQCISGVETHERYEWFRVDGKHHHDPHALGLPAFATDFTSKAV